MNGLKKTELLNVLDENGDLLLGGCQYWFPNEGGYWPNAACGPTTAANILTYLFRSRRAFYLAAREAGLEGFAAPALDSQQSPNKKDEYLKFMKQVYGYFRPGSMGLMSPSFLKGMELLAQEYSLPFSAERMVIPFSTAKRPAFDEVSSFIGESLEQDLPVAFLELHKGSTELDSWHWVTIIGFEKSSGVIAASDDGNLVHVDLGAWLATSILGGALVRIQANSD